LASIYYDRVAVENLKPNLPFVAVTSRRKLPDRNGRTIQLFGYDLLPANPTPGVEGTVGTGISPTTSIRNVTVNQYFDFASFSDILVETAIDPIVENTAAELGFRAALTANLLARMEFEAQAASDAAAVIAGTADEFMSAALARQAVFHLRGLDVRPQADGLFAGIIHPFPAFDLDMNWVVTTLYRWNSRPDNTEATCASRESVESIRVAPVRDEDVLRAA
jgi:N4-gp56 family major capsid protein